MNIEYLTLAKFVFIPDTIAPDPPQNLKIDTKPERPINITIQEVQ